MNNRKVSIYKFVLDPTLEIQRINAPHIIGALDVQVQETQVVLWAKVYADSTLRPYVILRCWTGDELAGDTAYLGTVQLPTGDVAHFFGGGPGL